MTNVALQNVLQAASVVDQFAGRGPDAATKHAINIQKSLTTVGSSLADYYRKQADGVLKEAQEYHSAMYRIAEGIEARTQQEADYAIRYIDRLKALGVLAEEAKALQNTELRHQQVQGTTS